MTRADLTGLVRTVPDFPAPGVLFRDITTLLADGSGFAAACGALAALATPLRPSLIAGIEARGFVFGAALASRLGLGFIPIRKPGKLPVPTLHRDYALEYGTGRLELDPTSIPPGARVLLVDDLLATGGTALAAAALLREAGAVVTDALFVIDLPDLGGTARLAAEGVQMQALMTFPGQ